MKAAQFLISAFATSAIILETADNQTLSKLGMTFYLHTDKSVLSA